MSTLSFFTERSSFHFRLGKIKRSTLSFFTEWSSFHFGLGKIKRSTLSFLKRAIKFLGLSDFAFFHGGLDDHSHPGGALSFLNWYCHFWKGWSSFWTKRGLSVNWLFFCAWFRTWRFANFFLDWGNSIF